MSATVQEVCGFLGVFTPPELAGHILQRVSAMENAGSDAVVFAADESSLRRALDSAAGLILAPSAVQSVDSRLSPSRVLFVPDPRTAFARVYAQWFQQRPVAAIHPSAVVAPDAVIGPGCSIAAGAIVEQGVRIGSQCVIGARVVLGSGTILGDRVRVQAGAVLAAEGFGYVRHEGRFLAFPQIGSLHIGDDVDIGANTTIDRGALGETRIGSGTKIDNLVHIAHNCTIGANVILAAQVGIAGSTVVEDGAIVGGQVGLAEHVHIGPGVILGAQCGVPTGKVLSGPGQVFWGTPARPIRSYLRDLAHLARLGEREGKD